MALWGGLFHVRTPSRKRRVWRVLYIPMCIFFSGVVYFHVLLVSSSRLPPYFVIDGVSYENAQDLHRQVWQPHWPADLVGKHQKSANADDAAAAGAALHMGLNESSNSSVVLYNVPKGQESYDASVVKRLAVNEWITRPRQAKIIDSVAGAGVGVGRNLSSLGRSSAAGAAVPFLQKWEPRTVRGCGRRFIGYSGKLVLLSDVLVNRSLASANASGGEDILSVKGRSEAAEIYNYKKGFFTLPCPEGGWKKAAFKPDPNKGYLSTWYDTLVTVNTTPSGVDGNHDGRFSIAVTRYEYANVYWTLVDVYNVYLTLTFFGQTRERTHVVILDAKPWSQLDSIWMAFFGSVSRLAQLPRAVTFSHLAWSFQRVHSPLLKGKPLPLHANFRTTMLQAFGIHETRVPPGGRYANNCTARTQRLNILFVWRRNYVAHPRNPSGIVTRKIANEEELLNATIRAFPKHNVSGLQLDKLSMREQMKVLSNCDVMIGMHGAAFAFTWFRPKGSGAIELFPANGGSNWHMKHIAISNDVFYDTWKNKNPRNELVHSKSTIIPPKTAIDLIRDMVDTICTGRQKVKPVVKPLAKRKSVRRPIQKVNVTGNKAKAIVKTHIQQAKLPGKVSQKRSRKDRI